MTLFRQKRHFSSVEFGCTGIHGEPLFFLETRDDFGLRQFEKQRTIEHHPGFFPVPGEIRFKAGTPIDRISDRIKFPVGESFLQAIKKRLSL